MNNQQHYKSGFLPVINSLPLSQNEKMLLSQLYGVNYPTQQQYYPQKQIQNPYLDSLNYAYQSNFIPAFTNNQQLKLPLIQSHVIDPLPMNYNLGLMVHQPGSQIRLGFDLSDFGIPNDPPKQRPVIRKQVPQQIYQQPQFDYFEEAEVPKIYLSNEQQYRLIKGKMNEQYKPTPMTEYKSNERQFEQFEQFQKQNSKSRSDIPFKQDESSGTQQIEEQQQTKKKEEKKKKRRLAPKLKNEKKRQFGDYSKPSIKKFKRKVSILSKMLVFIEIYVDALKFEIKKKKDLMQKAFKENQSEGSEMLLNWIDDIMYDFLLELLNTNDPLTIQIGQEKQNQQSKKKISQLFQLIQTQIVKNFKPDEVITGPLAVILNNLIQPFSIPPKAQFTLFEIKRLTTTQEGALGNLNVNQQKMILMVFLIIREITFNNIFRAWEQHPDQNLDNQQNLLLIQKNSIILSSILHEFVIKWVEQNVPLQQQLNLDELEKLFQFTSKPLVVKNKNQSNKNFPENLLIDGMMPNSLVQKYILNNKGNKEDWVVKLEDDFLKFIDQVLTQLNKEYELQKKSIKRERMSKIILNFINQ